MPASEEIIIPRTSRVGNTVGSIGMIILAAVYVTGYSLAPPIIAIFAFLVGVPLIFFQLRQLLKNFSSKPVLETSDLGLVVNHSVYRFIPWENINYIGLGIDRSPLLYSDSSKHISIFYFQGDDWMLARDDPSILDPQKKKQSIIFQGPLKQDTIVFGIHEFPQKHIKQLQERWLLAVEGKSCQM